METLKEMGIPDHLTCVLRNLYASQEQQLEPCMEQLTGSRLRKEYDRVLSPCLFDLYTEHIMRNARLDELQAGIKRGGRNINSLRYVDTTLMSER